MIRKKNFLILNINLNYLIYPLKIFKKNEKKIQFLNYLMLHRIVLTGVFAINDPPQFN